MKNRIILTVSAVALLFSLDGSTGILEDTVSCTATNELNFIPTWGKVEVGDDGGLRFIHQHMRWDTLARLKWFRDNLASTFEPDAFFYNFGESSSGQVIPGNGYAYGLSPIGQWHSNLPQTYIYTQLYDKPYNKYNEPTEAANTVGSALAAYIKPGIDYYTFTYMKNGRGNASWVKLAAQRGRLIPSWWYSTFASYACEAPPNNIQVIKYRQFTAPGCKQYYFYGTGNSNTIVKNC